MRENEHPDSVHRNPTIAIILLTVAGIRAGTP